MFKPPKDDGERLQNLVEALSEPGDEPDAVEAIIQARLAKRGHTMETYARELQAKTEAVLARHRRARRMRWLARGASAGAVLALAAGVLVYYVKGRDRGNAAQPTMDKGCSCEVASASSRGRELAPAAGLGLLLALLLLRRSKGRPEARPPPVVGSPRP